MAEAAIGRMVPIGRPRYGPIASVTLVGRSAAAAKLAMRCDFRIAGPSRTSSIPRSPRGSSPASSAAPSLPLLVCEGQVPRDEPHCRRLAPEGARYGLVAPWCPEPLAVLQRHRAADLSIALKPRSRRRSRSRRIIRVSHHGHLSKGPRGRRARPWRGFRVRGCEGRQSGVPRQRTPPFRGQVTQATIRARPRVA